MKELIKKIEDRRAIVGIIGLGYAGLPLAVKMQLFSPFGSM